MKSKQVVVFPKYQKIWDKLGENIKSGLYKNDPVTSAYASDLEALILKYKPLYWIHEFEIRFNPISKSFFPHHINYLRSKIELILKWIVF